MELCDLSAHDLAALIRKREVSSVEAVKSVIQRVEAVDGRPGSVEEHNPTSKEYQYEKEQVHAFITLTQDRALKQAEAVDQKIADETNDAESDKT